MEGYTQSLEVRHNPRQLSLLTFHLDSFSLNFYLHLIGALGTSYQDAFILIVSICYWLSSHVVAHFAQWQSVALVYFCDAKVSRSIRLVGNLFIAHLRTQIKLYGPELLFSHLTPYPGNCCITYQMEEGRCGATEQRAPRREVFTAENRSPIIVYIVPVMVYDHYRVLKHDDSIERALEGITYPYIFYRPQPKYTHNTKC